MERFKSIYISENVAELALEQMDRKEHNLSGADK